MSQEDNNNRTRPYSYFRFSLDMGMGLVYLALAGGVFWSRHFGTIELSSGVVYAMGGLLIIYGAFRIYRALADLRNNKQSGDS